MKRRLHILFLFLFIVTNGLLLATCFDLSARYNINEREYSLSTNSKKYELTEDRSPSKLEEIFPLILTDNEDKIFILMENGDKNLYIYDPTYIHDIQINYKQAGYTRLISNDDYLTRARVGYSIMDELDAPDLSSLNNQTGKKLKIINGMIRGTALSRPGIDYIVNMTSLENGGKYIYLDGDQEIIDKWTRNLKSHGYVQVRRPQIGFAELKVAAKSIGIQYVFISAIMAALLISTFLEAKKNLAFRYYMSYYYGATSLSMILTDKKFYFSLFLTSLATYIFLFISPIYRDLSFGVRLSPFYYLLCFFILDFIGNYFMLGKVKRGMR